MAESLSHEISNPISIISAYNYRLLITCSGQNFTTYNLFLNPKKNGWFYPSNHKVINAHEVYGEEDSMGNYFDVINLKDPLAYSLSLYHEKF